MTTTRETPTLTDAQATVLDFVPDDEFRRESVIVNALADLDRDYFGQTDWITFQERTERALMALYHYGRVSMRQTQTGRLWRKV